MLQGPVTRSSFAISRAIRFALPRMGTVMSTGGSTSVASPLCTPASSTCSVIAQSTTSPSRATRSSSISRAPSSNRETTTGCSCETAFAFFRMRPSSFGSWATDIAAPLST